MLFEAEVGGGEGYGGEGVAALGLADYAHAFSYLIDYDVLLVDVRREGQAPGAAAEEGALANLAHNPLNHRFGLAVVAAKQLQELLAAVVVTYGPEATAGAAGKEYQLHNGYYLLRTAGFA